MISDDLQEADAFRMETVGRDLCVPQKLIDIGTRSNEELADAIRKLKTLT